MKVFDLRGREGNWSFSGCRVLGNETRPRSGLHIRARGVLRASLGLNVIYEEVPIPGSRLRFDFVVPNLRLAVEVQGEQHFKFNPFMHKSKGEFINSLMRDKDKAVFCERNNFRLILFRFDGGDDDWTRLLEDSQG